MCTTTLCLHVIVLSSVSQGKTVSNGGASPEHHQRLVDTGEMLCEGEMLGEMLPHGRLFRPVYSKHVENLHEFHLRENYRDPFDGKCCRQATRIRHNKSLFKIIGREEKMFIWYSTN